MQTIKEYLKDNEIQKVVNEIIELKLKHPLSEEDKLMLQRLQQKLGQ